MKGKGVAVNVDRYALRSCTPSTLSTLTKSVSEPHRKLSTGVPI